MLVGHLLQSKDDLIIKDRLRKVHIGTIKTPLARVLIGYRIILHSTTGRSPSEMVFGRNLKTKLSLAHPDISSHVHEKSLVRSWVMTNHQHDHC